MSVITKNLEETFALGRKLGKLLQPQDTIALSGPLGVGKTQLVHGIAETYLQEHVHVCSPSFTIINQYTTNHKKIYHLDLYRLNSFDELESTGYWDTIEDPDALILIEWLEQVEKAKPLQYTQIHIDFLDENADLSQTARIFTLCDRQNSELYKRIQPIFNPWQT